MEKFDPLAELADRFRVAGTIRLDACPVCGSDGIGRVWQLPQTRVAGEARLAAPGSPVDGLYLHYLPMLKVPQDIYCFDACRRCQAIFQNPKSDDHAAYRVDSSKVASFRSAGASEFEGSAKAYRSRMPKGSTRIVDAACGAGQVLSLLRRDLPGAELIGLELSRPSVEFMNRELGITAFEVDLDLDDLDACVPEGSTDFVIFQEAFEHVRHPTLVLGKLVRMLRPGGRLHFTAQRYGEDNELQIRVGEPIFINETTLDHVVREVGARIVELRKDIKLRVVLERPADAPASQAASKGLRDALRDLPGRLHAIAPVPAGAAAATPPGGAGAGRLRRVSGPGPADAAHATVTEGAAAIEATLLPLLARRVEIVGEELSGARQFYRRRLAAGALLGTHEIEIASRLAQRASDFAAIHHIGAGLGQMAFLLALSGVSTLAVEMDARRVFTARLLLQRFAAAHPDLPKRCELLHGRFPGEAALAGAAQALALVTQLTAGSDPDERAHLLRALAGYRGVLVDIDRFLEPRSTNAERAAVVRMFADVGLTKAAAFADLGEAGRYVMFGRT